MRNINQTLVLLVLVVSCTARSAPVDTSFPDAPDISRKFIFYLHGRAVESKGPEGAPEDYWSILKTLNGRGFKVISEVRPEGSTVREYVVKTAEYVSRLISAGVPLENITVVGFSKGGQIALRTVAVLGNPKVN